MFVCDSVFVFVCVRAFGCVLMCIHVFLCMLVRDHSIVRLWYCVSVCLLAFVYVLELCAWSFHMYGCVCASVYISLRMCVLFVCFCLYSYYLCGLFVCFSLCVSACVFVCVRGFEFMSEKVYEYV